LGAAYFRSHSAHFDERGVGLSRAAKEHPKLLRAHAAEHNGAQLRMLKALMPSDPTASDPLPADCAPSELAHGHDAAQPNGDYLDRLMRRNSFEALWPLFAKATRPAKEMTESFSALEHLRPFMTKGQPCRVIHVGDGAHARTAALFSLKTDADNISVDPLLNLGLIEDWRARFGIRGLTLRKARIDDVANELNALPAMPVLVTFVHAHVHVDEVLDRLRWDAAFTLACCIPGHQLTQTRVPRRDGIDLSVLSGDRRYQVLVNGTREPGATR
jgi:hypothetical protein